MHTMNQAISRLARLALALLVLGVSSVAFALDTWKYDTDPNKSTGNLSTLCTPDQPTPVANCGKGITAVGGYSTAPDNAPSAKFGAGLVFDYGETLGLGVTSKTSADGTSIDNYQGTDALLMHFTAETNLKSLILGFNPAAGHAVTEILYAPPTLKADGTYSSVCETEVDSVTCKTVTYNDADLSIFAWFGSPTQTPTVTGTALEDMYKATAVTALPPLDPASGAAANSIVLANDPCVKAISTGINTDTHTADCSSLNQSASSSGWILVGNYFKGDSKTDLKTNVYSSYWLVSAYNSAYSNPGTGGGLLDVGKAEVPVLYDAFKVLGIKASTYCQDKSGLDRRTCTNETPEPGSLALFGVAVMGVIATQRRRKRAV